VRCLGCFRVERWQPGSPPEVISAGGDRRPTVHPSLQAWRTLRRSRRGEVGAIVGRCPQCDQPLVLESGTRPALPRWEIPVPTGLLVVGPTIDAPQGPLTEDEADRWMEGLYPYAGPRIHVYETFAGFGCIAAIAVVLGFWLLAASYAVFFIWGALPFFNPGI
jgi:hypothetical protein